MEIFGGIFINYMASVILFGFFAAHVGDKAIECAAVIKHLGKYATVKINRGFGLIAWLACVLPGYSTMPITWWWSYFTPVLVLVIIIADIWLVKHECEPAYYKYVLWVFGTIYAVSLVLSGVGMYWRF